MPMQDWIHKYPRVLALLTHEGEVLDYDPDGASAPAPPAWRPVRDVPSRDVHVHNYGPAWQFVAFTHAATAVLDAYPEATCYSCLGTTLYIVETRKARAVLADVRQTGLHVTCDFPDRPLQAWELADEPPQGR